MSGITIKELGLGFVRACMETYWGSCLFPLLFAAGILWALFCHKKQASRIFLFYTVFLFLTVYNPVLVKYVIPKLHFENEYYRFIWILPVIPGVAYYGVRLVYLFKRKWQRILAALLVMGIIVSVGTPIEGIVGNFALAENLYKVPNELRAVCDVIHQDSEKENPRVVFDSSLNSIARQYDPSLGLVLHRNAIIYRSGSTVAGTFDEKAPGTKDRKQLWMWCFTRNRIIWNCFKRLCIGQKQIILCFLQSLVTMISSEVRVARW